MPIRFRTAMAVVIAAFSTLWMASSPPSPAPQVEPERIRDEAGRIHYIVDLHEDASKGFSTLAPPHDGFPNWHKTKTRHLLQQMKREYGFTPTSMTSLVGSSFAAFLTEKQVERLRQDQRVKRITPDGYAELSAVWTDTSSGGRTLPWGVQAVGGSVASRGTATVYVLDSGVAVHANLPNVVERLSATGKSPIGCYPHATHVAGIIGAKTSGSGVSGVNAGVKIVSVAVGHIAGNGCSSGSIYSNVEVGMDLIKARIMASGRVGIVNISLNNPLFRLGQTTGDKLRNLATPVLPSYPGAFVVESAGNDYRDACQYAYDGKSSTDGVMVVGAIDANGHPVTPLNGSVGFRNAGTGIASQPGSNYGPCVEAWAPGNKIYSTWNPGYMVVSGTSMAAPHVTGLASYLVETQGLTTPQAIETAVRARLVPLWGSTAVIPNLNSQSRYAEPTVEFNESNIPLGHFERFHTEPITTFRYASIGANTCTLRGFINGTPWYTTANAGTAYTWPSFTLGPNAYRWTLDCVSPYGVHGSAEATARILRQVTKAAWVASSASTGYAEVETENGSFTWTLTGAFTQRYVSENADNCEVKSHGYTIHPNTDAVLLWQSGTYPTAWNFGQFQPGDPKTAAPPLGPYSGYYWELRCWNSDGGQRYGVMQGTLKR